MDAPVNTLGADYRLLDFRIERVLATGPGSITYCAVDTRNGETVVLREYFPFAQAVRSAAGDVRPASLDVAAAFKQGRDDFHSLARRFAGIDHPGVAALQHWCSANNTVYHMLRYVPGATLHDVLEHRGRLRGALLQRLFTDVLPALAELHRHGVVHGGISPRHLIVRDDDRVVLTGLAAPAIRDAYTAPELTRGAAPTPRADLYAFGVTAYRCVSGLAERDLAAALQRQRPAPARKAGAGRYAREALQAIDLATQPEPAARPDSARTLLAAAIASGGGTQDTPRARGRRTLLAGTALAAVFAASAGIWHYESRLSQATALAVRSNVADAQVYLDGAPVGRAGPGKPFEISGLDAGAHRVRVEASRHEPFAATVTVEKGERHKVSAQLAVQTATLRVASNVTGYALYVDDRPVIPSAPNEYPLPLGQREVRIEKPGYLPHEQTLELRDTAPRTLAVDLQPRCRQVARVEQQCQDQPLQRFREQLVTQSKPVEQQVRKEMRVLGNPRYRNTRVEELQYAACSGARHDAETRLRNDCRLEPRAGEFSVTDVDFGLCRCEATHARDIYGRRVLAGVNCTVTARALCAVEIRRAVRYMDANPQCEDVLVTDTICGG